MKLEKLMKAAKKERRKAKKRVRRLDAILDRVNCIDALIEERLDQYDVIVQGERLNGLLRKLKEDRKATYENAEYLKG